MAKGECKTLRRVTPPAQAEARTHVVSLGPKSRSYARLRRRLPNAMAAAMKMIGMGARVACCPPAQP